MGALEQSKQRGAHTVVAMVMIMVMIIGGGVPSQPPERAGAGRSGGWGSPRKIQLLSLFPKRNYENMKMNNDMHSRMVWNINTELT